MNFVPCLAWVARGLAKSLPDKLQLSAEELKKLVAETKNATKVDQNDEESDGWETESDEEGSGKEKEPESFSNQRSIKKESKNGKECESDAEDETQNCGDDPENKSAEDDDIDAKYNMEDYDNDDDQPFMNITDVATFIDNKEDNYITDFDAVKEDEERDKEDFFIKASDNLLVVGHIEEESSVLEVHIYNKEEDAFYVHHDIVLPAYPLALEWLDFHPSEETPGNYVAVGDMTPVIKIWDLDVVEVLEPDYCLEEKSKSKKKNGEKKKLKCHTDSVISLSWNKHNRNILASGSADSTILIWDLQEGNALHQLKFHTNKVQSLQWHPFENSFLLSSCTDGLLKLFDCRAPDAECKSWSVDGEIEKVSWNLLDSLKFFCSTEDGFVHGFDLRKSEVEHSVKAHSDGVTALDMCNQHPSVLLTASMDKTLKLWDIKDGFKLINSQKLKLGSIYTAKFAPDSELPVAVGGNYASNSLKIIDLAEVIGSSGENKSAPKIKVECESSAPIRKIKKPKQPQTTTPEYDSSSTNVKLEKPEYPKNKKLKLVNTSTNNGQNFNLKMKKTFQNRTGETIVKRIHKTYD